MQALHANPPICCCCCCSLHQLLLAPHHTTPHHITPPQEPKACTIVLRGASKDVLNEVERNLHVSGRFFRYYFDQGLTWVCPEFDQGLTRAGGVQGGAQRGRAQPAREWSIFQILLCPEFDQSLTQRGAVQPAREWQLVVNLALTRV